jgi:hypothetical protein
MALTMLSVPPLAFWGQSETISGVGAYIDCPSPSYTPNHNRIDSRSMHSRDERIFNELINRYHSSNVALSAFDKETGSLGFVSFGFFRLDREQEHK